MTKPIGWELYRSFLAVLAEGSLSGAARALGITQPTVGRHIAALERALGQVLFTRSQTGLLATDAALALRGYAEAMHSHAAALERAAAAQGPGVSGTVRISASEVIGIEVLPPVLARLRRDHPRLTLELAPTNRVQNLLLREADIAVRMAPPKQEQLIARPVGHVDIGLYARKDYLRHRGTPATLADLAGHTLIGYDTETPFLRGAGKRLAVPWSRDSFALRADSDLAQLALIRAGAGIGFCQVALARRDRRLAPVLPNHVSFQLETWITMHEDLRASPRCKAVFDALVQCLLAHTGATR